MIDTEVIMLVEEGEARARKIITENRSVLEKIATLLQEKEVINREEISALLEK